MPFSQDSTARRCANNRETNLSWILGGFSALSFGQDKSFYKFVNDILYSNFISFEVFKITEHVIHFRKQIWYL